MAYRELRPHSALRPFVDRFWVLTGDAGAGPRRILPDGCIDLIVDLAGAGAPVAVGTMTRALLFHPRSPVRSVGVRFRPAGAVPFLRIAADELTDRVVPCAALGMRWLAPAHVGLGADPDADLDADPRSVIGRLERCLLDRMPAARAPDPVVARAVARLFSAAPPSIAGLAGETGCSRQHLTRLFRSQVGVGAKQLARVARLQRAVGDLQRPDAALELADAAIRLGYCDQAHMARDFRELADITPGAARTSAGSIHPIRSLLGGS